MPLELDPNARLTDGGPVYVETVSHQHELMHGGIVEPWNATTAVFFLLIAVYWAWQQWKRPAGSTNRRLKLWAAGILALGGIGGTIFHGTRSHVIWLMLDVLPIIILIFMYCIYLFRKMGALKQAFVLIALSGLLRLTFRWIGLTEQAGITVGYASMGLLILYPIVLYLQKLQYANARWVLAALGAFAMALIARISDSHFADFLLQNWPHGTHFIWHSMGAVAVACLIHFWGLSDETEARIGLG